MSDTATLEVLIQIREQLAGLTKTREGLQGAKKDAESLGSVIKQGLGIGTGMEIARRGVELLTEGFKESVGAAFELAAQVKDQSEALDLTTDAYQVLRYEMTQAGVDAGRMSMAISTQTQSLALARSGAGDAAEAYRTLGLSITEVEQLTPEKRLEVVARATLNASDKTKGFQAASTILGQRGLPQLLNALRTLATDGYGSVEAAAKSAGAVMEKETIDLLDRTKKQVDNFKAFTLPVATGTAIGWAQSAMDAVGGAAGNAYNLLIGAPLVDHLDTGGEAQKAKDPKVTTFATDRDVLALRASLAEQKAGQIQNASLLDETQKRQALVPILDEQLAIYTKLIAVRFGDKGTSLPTDGKVTDEELTNYKDRNELEAKLVAIRQQRMVAVDTPLLKLARDLNDTATYANETLASGLGTAVNSLQADLWSAAKGTESWRDAFRNLGSTAVDILGQIVTRMLVVSSLNAVLGIFGTSLGALGATAATSGTVKTPLPDIKWTNAQMAGGGSFLTRGPMHLTVGDNPGGVEMVNVTPISGVGRSTINGRAMKMAGGGSLIAAGAMGGGDTFNFSYAFQGGVTRQEVLAMLPGMVDASKSAVLEAKKRHRGGF